MQDCCVVSSSQNVAYISWLPSSQFSHAIAMVQQPQHLLACSNTCSNIQSALRYRWVTVGANIGIFSSCIICAFWQEIGGLSNFRFRERIAIAEIQEGLKNVVVCKVHKEYMDKLHLMAIANAFIALKERRMQLFGKFWNCISLWLSLSLLINSVEVRSAFLENKLFN